jgi:cytolysin-activating lysine-acyltransferase
MRSNLQSLLSHKGLLHDMRPDRIAQLQGEVMSLYLASARHRSVTIDEFAASVMPAIHFNQFRIYRDSRRRPVGWVTWAFMTDQEAKDFMSGGYSFPIDAWIGGEHLWFMDVIAPYGHVSRIAEDLRQNVFPNRVGFAPDLESRDGSKRVRRFFGAGVGGNGKQVVDDEFLASVAR